MRVKTSNRKNMVSKNIKVRKEKVDTKDRVLLIMTDELQSTFSVAGKLLISEPTARKYLKELTKEGLLIHHPANFISEIGYRRGRWSLKSMETEYAEKLRLKYGIHL